MPLEPRAARAAPAASSPSDVVASIGAVASPAQGVSYYERDGYYTKDDPAHREASAWTGKGAGTLGLRGAVDPETFRNVLAGKVPDGSGRRLGRKDRDGHLHHRPGRDVTLSAPKSVSLVALVGGDARVVAAHGAAVRRTLAWLERDVVETRRQDPDTGRMVRAREQGMVAATFRHDTSRNLDPQLHTHAVLPNMVHGPDDKWRTMANESLYRSQKLIGAVYRTELAQALAGLGYRIEKTHPDGRFEIAGVPRRVIEAFSTRRAEIEAAMAGRDLGDPAAAPRLAERAALLTRAHKRDVDKGALRGSWQRQAAELGFDAGALVAGTLDKDAGIDHAGDATAPGPQAQPESVRGNAADRAVAWAVAHRSEREAVFARADLLADALAWRPGAVSVDEAERAVDRLERAGALHAARLPGRDACLTTDKAVADEKETVALMREGAGRGAAPMRERAVDKALRNGPLTAGQKEAVKLITSGRDRVVGVQGYAGSGKTTMLSRARALLEKRGFEVTGLAPSASAASTLAREAGIGSETLQRFLARNAGVAEGRLTARGTRTMRAAFRKTVLVVDEGSLASTVQARDLLRIAKELRIAKVVLVGDEKQLDAVDAGKPFAQLQRAGMTTAVMDEILRQKDPALKAAVEASLAGDVRAAFERLGPNVAGVKADNLAGAAAARWLKLSPEARENAGLMAPSHALRERINAIVRERLIRDGAIRGPALATERLVSLGYTRAEKTLTESYAEGHVVAFHRAYKRLGVEKGDELRVAGTDPKTGTVALEKADGNTVAWQPHRLAGNSGGVEVYRSEAMELREGDRIRWTKNDAGLGLVNSRTAEVAGVKDRTVTFRLEDGRTLALHRDDPRLCHVDRAWASTVHAFQGRTVDTVIAAMEANHPHLTTQKTFYVEISRARHRAELVTDDRDALRERIEAATGERVAALEVVEPERAKMRETGPETVRGPDRKGTASGFGPPSPEPEKTPEPHRIEHDLGI